MNLDDLTLAAASRMLHTRQVSAVELTDLCLARIAALNPSLNAFITVTADAARADARRADEERARGRERGPLHGIPLALKDLFDTRGVRTSAGSKIWRERVPADDAAATARLRAAGAVLLGKTNMHEWAYGVTNANPHFGRTANPWEASRSPGGSSGGSAAAVAARMCLGALGSDTGGSIRIPAALCGVTGLKPTFGRVSLRGVIPLSWSMDHAGPLAQTAQDCALLLQAIAGYDPLDPATSNVPAPDYAAALLRPGSGQADQPLAGIRLAVPSGHFRAQVDADILSAVDEGTRVLAQCGARLIRKEVPFAEELFALNRTILRVEAAAVHRAEMEERPDDFGADVLTRLREGTQIAADAYARARRRQVELTRALDQYFDDADLLVTPTTRIAAPRWDLDPVALSGHLTAFTAPFNLTGFPALSVPCGFTRESLPIGLQLVARPWNEALLLRAAHQYQRLTDWHTRQPPTVR